jgi:hypothetical protein
MRMNKSIYLKTIKMELVKEIRKEKSINPKIQLIYSVPKAGKTSIVGQLEDALILELEPNGADYISGRIQEIKRPSEFDEVLRLMEESKEKVATYLVVDTVTKLDEWSEIVGTYNYMKKPQGKRFNRAGGIETGETIKHTSVEFETVHELGQGYGYKYSREAMTNWYDRLANLIANGKIDYVILLAHVKDKLVESKNGDSVETIDINLTGKVKSIYASRIDAIGHFYRDSGKGYISYDNEYKVVCGGRCKHLENSMLISEKQDDKSIKTYWENIYLK